MCFFSMANGCTSWIVATILGLFHAVVGKSIDHWYYYYLLTVNVEEPFFSDKHLQYLRRYYVDWISHDFTEATWHIPWVAPPPRMLARGKALDWYPEKMLQTSSWWGRVVRILGGHRDTYRVFAHLSFGKMPPIHYTPEVWQENLWKVTGPPKRKKASSPIILQGRTVKLHGW